MDKYLDLVYKHPDVENSAQYYNKQCQKFCEKCNDFFLYGEIYLSKCARRCKNNENEYRKKIEASREILKSQIQECEKKSESLIKQCIYDFQEKAFQTIRSYRESLDNELN